MESLFIGQRRMGLGQIERAWRRGWMRSIGMLSAGERVAKLPRWNERPHAVLYMRTQGIGDLILATGALRAIAHAQPSLALDVLTTAQASPVLERNPYVRRVYVLPRTPRGVLEIVRTIRREKYDVVIDGKITRGASFIRSPALTLASRAPFRVGVGGGNHPLVFNVCVDRFDRTTTHMIEGSAALATPFGVDLLTADLRPEIFLSELETMAADEVWCNSTGRDENRRERWLINISAGAALRRWPNDRWTALVKHLRARRPEATIIIVGSSGEWSSVCDVAYRGDAVAVPTRRLRDVLALVGTSTRVITTDTSITHAASAFCIPTVILIQRGLSQWLPWKTPHSAAYWSGSTIESLSVATACEALDDLLQCSQPG